MRTSQINKNKSMLFDALCSDKGIQHITDVASQIFQNPIVVADIANNVLAKTAGYPFFGISEGDDSQPAFLNEMLSDLSRRNKLSQQFALNDGRPLITTATPDRRYCLCLIRVRSTIVAHLAICQEWTELNEDIIPLVEMLAKVLALELQKGNYNLVEGFAVSRLFLSDLLEKRLTSHKAIDQRLSKLNWVPDDDLCVAFITGRAEVPNQLLLQNTINFLKTVIPKHLSALTDTGIVLLATTGRGKGFSCFDDLVFADYLNDCGLHCGIGNVFYDLLSVPTAYSQAASILNLSHKLGNAAPVVYFRDWYFSSILDMCSNKMDLLSLCMPEMLLLREYDQTHSSPLIPTLKTFLDFALDYNRTAQALFIHRNTLNYRLSKIKSILSLDTLSGENLQRILLSLRVFEYLDAVGRSQPDKG